MKVPNRGVLIALSVIAVAVTVLGARTGSAQEPPDPDSWNQGGRSPGEPRLYTGGRVVFPSALGAPLAIPDAVPAGVDDALIIGDTRTIQDLNVSLNISHTWVGDLKVILTHTDSGTSVTILDRPGVPAGAFGCASDNILATLDDEAASPVENACGATPAIGGSFTPNNPLSAFNGESVAGTWVLNVSDQVGSDVGALNAWSLDLFTNGDGTFLDQIAAPIAIPDNVPAGVTNSIVVADPRPIKDLDVSVGITHTWVGDLIVTLTHTDTGTSVTMVDRPGRPPAGPGFGCSGNNISALLDDEAVSPVENECAGAVPTISGTFTPNNALMAFDGESMAGTWQFTVSDNAGGDIGMLDDWGLFADLVFPECPPAAGNDGFEAGQVDSNLIPCWTVESQPSAFPGSWCTQSDTLLPGGDCVPGGAAPGPPPPPQGTKAAMSNETGNSSFVLYRCGIPTSGALSFRLSLNNVNIDFFNPPSLDYNTPSNQQFRVDLVRPDGMRAYPFTVAPADVLLNIYQTLPGDPPIIPGYTTVNADISAFIGQNVCLRFAQVQNQFFFYVGIDDVQFITKAPKADPEGDGLPNDPDLDDDNDGCADLREFQTAVGSQTTGGRRDPHNFWDFYDVPTGAGLLRDRAVAGPDIFGVIGRFNTAGNPMIDPLSPPPPAGYHPAYDRGPLVGPDPWDLGPANGSVAGTDIFAVIAQFNHSCV